MRAAVCPQHGPPEVVRMEDVPTRSPERGEVAVAVHAAAVNFPDVLICANQYQVEVATPFVPGSEFAGVVAEAGDDVRDLAVGDRVFGALMVGAFAQRAIVSADRLTRTPDAIDDAHAAAFGVAHRTAYHSLRSVAKVAGGEELIVLGAGGGVGLAAVQLGVILGATVTAVASSPEKLGAAAAMGATHLINHRDSSLRATLREVLPDGADVVIDPVGGALAEPALRALRYGGRFVTVGYAAGEIPRIPLNLVLLKGCQILGFQASSFAAHEPDAVARNDAELLRLLAEGKAVPHIGARFAFEDAATALRYVADGKAIGKVVLDQFV